MKKTAEERFWSKVQKTEHCWIWTAGRQGTNQYGYFRAHPNKNGNVVSHRYSYELIHGTIPEGMLVCHTCDNPLCVRPDHLFLGTHKDNAIDRNSKGRGKVPRKLTEEEATLIKYSNISQSKLAKQYGISRRTVASIQYGETWKSITNESRLDFIETKIRICAICGKESTKSIHVDLNYHFRKINDLLCLVCDRAMKLFNYDQSNILKALAFIQTGSDSGTT